MRFGTFVSSCSSYVPAEEVTIMCGLGRASKRSQKFVRFLAMEGRKKVSINPELRPPLVPSVA